MSEDLKLDHLAASLPFGGMPLAGVLTAGQPSAEHLVQLAGAGCRTVVDLRAPAEPRGYDESEAAARAGLDYVLLPITAQSLSDAEFDRMRDELRDPAKRPVLVHCASANRVGALLVPFLILDENRSADDATAMARSIGLRSPELLARAMDYVSRHR